MIKVKLSSVGSKALILAFAVLASWFLFYLSWNLIY